MVVRYDNTFSCTIHHRSPGDMTQEYTFRALRLPLKRTGTDVALVRRKCRIDRRKGWPCLRPRRNDALALLHGLAPAEARVLEFAYAVSGSSCPARASGARRRGWTEGARGSQGLSARGCGGGRLCISCLNPQAGRKRLNGLGQSDELALMASRSCERCGRDRYGPFCT